MKKNNNENLYSPIKKMFALNDKQTTTYLERLNNTIDGFTEKFGARDNLRFFSAPGRTEIGGNHTDHQHGKVICASVNTDIIAVVSQNDSDIINVKSFGYDTDTININDTDIKSSEENKAISLLRGIANKFKEMGYSIKGFDAYTTSTVLKGSGLSSSAAYEVVIANIFNSLFANNEIDSVEIAKISQYAENVYFGKPCGLMDQMGCSVGGIISIDFKDPKNPIINKMDFTLDDYSLCIIDSCADHADLTHEYAAVPEEMKSVANFFGKEVLRDVDKNDFYDKIAELRSVVSDRAILRSAHFFEENERVDLEFKAIKDADYENFNKLIIKSGHSSFMYLQNVFAASMPHNQAVSIVLSTCERLLNGKGAYRVHGGGFAGTIQAFVPNEILDDFKTNIEKVVGKDKCYVLNIRPIGGTEIK